MAYPWTALLSSAILLLLTAPAALSAFDCNAGDRAALLAVKHGLGSPPLLATWLPNTNCFAWDNLYCDTTTGRVYNVYIYDAGVAPGTPVPAAFGDLPFLESLSLEDMPGLSGPIAPSFARLSRLSLLGISNTSVSGQVPAFSDPIRHIILI
ncbi:polygalacturonase inhibitor-like [Zingiber officinale]|uniref:Leucine-rich repeat-containing N-terminal plant-type domain-containing protein n=1 Tax=Zingiber officinale TaxID=94328 RepID=A0A8J5HWK2_ZINOF|nr:polygalacturonase inhibitor-like [Zingiber officinale]KAG6534833.1 hypothetical protein ZIOFF_008738 [Zingiber officinale]